MACWGVKLVRGGSGLKGDKFVDGKAVSVEGDVAAVGGGEEADAAEAEHVKDLGTESVTAKIHVDGFEGAGMGIGGRALGNGEAGAGLGHVDKGATAILSDALHGGFDGATGGGVFGMGGGEDILEDIFGLDADKGGLGGEFTHGEGEVDALIGEGAENVEGPVAVSVGERLGSDLFDELFAVMAIFDQLLYGDDAEAEAFLEAEQFGEACHGAVLVEDLANDAGGGEAGEDGEIDGGLGMAGALEDATGSGAKRKNVARLDELVGGGLRIGNDADSGAAIGGGNASGDAIGGIDGDGEVGAMGFAVIGDHGIEAEAFKLGLDGGGADQATGMADHGIDGFRGGAGGGHDHIALVFAVFVIGDDDQLALGDGVDGPFNGIKWILRHGKERNERLRE